MSETPPKRGKKKAANPPAKGSKSPPTKGSKSTQESTTSTSQTTTDSVSTASDKQSQPQINPPTISTVTPTTLPSTTTESQRKPPRTVPTFMPQVPGRLTIRPSPNLTLGGVPKVKFNFSIEIDLFEIFLTIFLTLKARIHAKYSLSCKGSSTIVQEKRRVSTNFIF